ncbi:hypothetical protein RhiirA1_443979 [Rhizophagus irregularis]|uniref:Uncharacterized protein n=2 Tax=Rhizophagus irregularis TaxID=588596 RepID=A0A2N0RG82_9GLOM|nr:hypothetical protein RhiirA1_443979 [Rhizophagus irregularis]
MIQGFKFTELRFKICSLANHSVASRRNALDLIMQNALQLKLPNQEQPQVTQNDLLYNEIIILFENKKVGWTGGLHLSVGVKCIERLAKPLWYIDPHLKKFAKRACYLPNLFTELLTYEQNQSYNQYYSITHHKYEEVSHEKLDKLIKSFKLSLAQPWTQDTLWALLIEDLYKLIEMDSNITVDLRINNGFKGTSFDIFWEEVDSYFNENTPAVDDRRHGSTLYIPIVLSIRDLRESIISRLQTRLGNPLPSETNIPSDEWIRVQFTPKNTLAHSVINYTGRFNIRYKVQARLLRKDHPDSHYCAGYFRYLREFAIKGPDHRITYGSVQVSLLCLFIRGNFDMLIAMRTAPAQSWTNSAERIMSILKSWFTRRGSP